MQFIFRSLTYSCFLPNSSTFTALLFSVVAFWGVENGLVVQFRAAYSFAEGMTPLPAPIPVGVKSNQSVKTMRSSTEQLSCSLK